MAKIESTPTCGAAVTFRNLTMVPLLAASRGEPDYDLLDEALSRGTLHITEVTDAGHVPEIRVRNDALRSVLIIDGEELVGAKQNRTVNLTILVPAAADVVVPVTCVEAGRWSSKSRHFSSSPQTHFAAGRAAKSAQVSASLVAHGVPRADQQGVWDQIAGKSARLHASSPTGAMSAMFEANSIGVDSHVEALPPAAGQVGAVFLLDDELAGLDLFAHARTLRALLPKIIRGYALDALDRDSASSPRAPGAAAARSPRWFESRAAEFVNRVLSAQRQQFAAPGVGETWRLFAPQLTGGLLSYDGNVLHLSAFAA